MVASSLSIASQYVCAVFSNFRPVCVRSQAINSAENLALLKPLLTAGVLDRPSHE